MISVREAEGIIAKHLGDFGSEYVAIEDSLGRTLAEPILADRDLPPYNRVTMDGISINYKDWSNGIKSYTIAGIQAAGMAQKRSLAAGECYEVMTGAILPAGMDTVIRYEDLRIEGDLVTINIETLKRHQNIHPQGHDRILGETLINEGQDIQAAEINLLATVGKKQILVRALPKVIIISTGDELVPIDHNPLDHQVRRSNVYGIQGVLTTLGISAATAHINDDHNELTQQIDEFLNTYDLIVLSGGVSKGKFDFIPEVLEKLNVKKLFHKVRQRPGKPFWFGRHPRGTTVFALPGNPVSSFLCCHRYLVPWLISSIKEGKIPEIKAQLNRDIHFNKDLDYFAQVKLKWYEHSLIAIGVEGNGSGDLANLSRGDAFIQLPRGKDHFKKGESYRVFPYRSLNDII